MPRFLLFVVVGSFGATLFYSFLPIALALSLNQLFPFGFDALPPTTVRLFSLVCVALILPVSSIAVVRAGRRMFFGQSSGRPALLGFAGTGQVAARSYRRRTASALGASALSIVAAVALAFYASRAAQPTGFAPYVLALCLAAIAAVLVAIELNDLRRTANLGLR
jgi:hypothetical protein